MSEIRIKDIYAGMPDANDEINASQGEEFYDSFIVPPGLPVDNLLEGRKYLVKGDKGVGKTAVLYYLQRKVHDRDEYAVTSFIYFKSDFEEYKRSSMENVARKLISIVDVSGQIQESRVEYLYIWRWVFYRKFVDDCEEKNNGLFVQDDNWYQFVKLVKQISFHSTDKKVLSLSSLSVEIGYNGNEGINAKASANFERVSNSQQAFHKFVEIVDKCRELFAKLIRTDTPYYVFVDEMEAYYGDKEQFNRDLTLIRDLIFTIREINGYGIVRIIAAIRNEIIHSMERFIPTNEINKVIEGFGVPLRWSYTNSTSVKHPIIQILMKRISMAANGREQSFRDWFPLYIHDKFTVSYILDNGWNKPRDIVRFLTAAQNDAIHCNDTQFSIASFDALQKEYSNNSLTEMRQELQSLYTVAEIEIILDLLRGRSRFFRPEELITRAESIYSDSIRSRTLAFLNERLDKVIKDFYRVGFWGNVNRRKSSQYLWHWNHRGDPDVITAGEWELAVHPALNNALSIVAEDYD